MMSTETGRRADLFLVGVGVYGLRQMTVETREVLRRAARVLHLTPHHEQLSRINRETEDLAPRYWRRGRAWDIYMAIARYVVLTASKARPTAFAVNGNPMVFNDICWEIARLGREEGLLVEALPAVSCIDVLPIQLGFDLGDLGTQVLEATQMVMFDLSINRHMSTLILQAAEFGARSTQQCSHPTARRLGPLVRHLRKFFPGHHQVIFLRSASSPADPSLVVSTTINGIADRAPEIERGMTLYVPRIGIPAVATQVSAPRGARVRERDSERRH